MQHIYMTCTANGHNKFYEMTELSNPSGYFLARWGVIGSNGQTKQYSMSEWQRIYSNKMSKGYVQQIHPQQSAPSQDATIPAEIQCETINKKIAQDFKENDIKYLLMVPPDSYKQSGIVADRITGLFGAALKRVQKASSATGDRSMIGKIENEIVDFTTQIRNTRVMFKIVAQKDFTLQDGTEIHKGQVGGWVNNEACLSQYGTCWISEGSTAFSSPASPIVSGNAIVAGNSLVLNSNVQENAVVKDSAAAINMDYNLTSPSNYIGGESVIYGNAAVIGGKIQNAWVGGNAVVYFSTLTEDDWYENDETIFGI